MPTYDPGPNVTKVGKLCGIAVSVAGLPGRMYQLTFYPGVPPSDVCGAVLPAAGGDVSCVIIAGGTSQSLASILLPGIPVLIEAGATFASGATLMTDASGRAIPWTSGNVALLTALGSAVAAGDYIWCRVNSGR